MLRLDESHPLNAGVLRFLGRRGGEAIVPHDSMLEPYIRLGSHPETVERIWDTLGSRMPLDCRCIVHRTPALVHPLSGIVFAFSHGTTYCLRFSPKGYREALSKGSTAIERFADTGTEDLRQELGPDWLFGHWTVDEVRWLTAMYERLKRAPRE